MLIENLISNATLLNGWEGKIIADLDHIKARLFYLTPDKEMVEFEEGHSVKEWVLVLSGEVIVQTPTETLTLKTGGSFIIPIGTLHRLNVPEKTCHRYYCA